MLEQGIDVSKFQEDEEKKYTFDLLKALCIYTEHERKEHQ
jgi:hypothetical protein